jgi:hypothetical protein
MIITKSDGTKVSSKNACFGSDQPPMFKCPKCGCVYWGPTDIVSMLDPNANGFICNECGTELEAFSK